MTAALEYSRLPRSQGTVRGATPRQLAVLRLIAGYIRQYKYPPTRREIGEALGIGSSNAVADLFALFADGAEVGAVVIGVQLGLATGGLADEGGGVGLGGHLDLISYFPT